MDTGCGPIGGDASSGDMEGCEVKTPQEKYCNDPQYKMLVDTLWSLIEKAQFTPSEIREAAMDAAIRHEQTRIHPPYIITEKGNWREAK